MSEGPRNTLAVSLWDGQLRGAAANARTVMRPVQHPPQRLATARELFDAAYPRFAEACRAVDEPGLAVIAVDEASGRAAGLATLRARVQRPVAAIVGRHDRCDLYLHGREQLSLRQLAVILDPVTSWQRGASAVRYRVLDLRTQEPMIDESGRPLRGIVAEGPAILRCAGYLLFLLPLGDPTDWPAAAADAWAMLPDRVYLDELSRAPQGSRQVSLPRVDSRATYITRVGGPRDSSMRLAQGELAGVLELHTPHRQLALSIGHAALQDGVLLGRYQRCDATEAAGEDHSVSRVHALLIQIDQRVLLVDTASSNGTFERELPARVVMIEQGTEVRLGKHTLVRWRWVG